MIEKYLEYSISSTRLNNLCEDLKLTTREILNLATKTFKMSAKDFAKKVRQRANKELGISAKKLKCRIQQYVINDLKQKIFSGFYKTGITNWRAIPSKPSPKNRFKYSGVSYGRPGHKTLIPHAFIAVMPEGGTIAVKRTGKYSEATKGRYKGQLREKLVKQYTKQNEIEEALEPILEEETIKFYKIFEKAFNKQVDKVLNKG